MSVMPAITVAEEDFNRLMTLVEKSPAGHEVAEGLEEELSRADLLPLAEIPDSVVTMNSVVRFLNEDENEEHELELVYPHEVAAGDSRISILAPAGAALLGLSIGDSIEWPVRGRKSLHLKIVRVTRKSRS